MSIDRTTAWPYDERGEVRDFYYSRDAHPTGVAAERELGRLEGGDALLYASGMGAIATILLAFGRSGATVAVADGIYYGTGKLVSLLEPFGLRRVEFDQAQSPPAADIVIVEAPANPVL
jgi:cystathionine beta-lyase/cystathionine gamma-synthase